MYLGIDLGTSGVKAALVDGAGALHTIASAPLTVQRPRAGWSEQDPNSWIAATKAALAQLDLRAVKSIGLSGQMHGATLLDAADRPLRPCLLWNDTRAGAQAAALDADPAIQGRTGNRVFAGFTAPKVEWLRMHEPQIFAATKSILLPKDYVRLWLTGAKVTDPSDASGTSWFNPATRDWDQDLIDPALLPHVVEGTVASGTVRAGLGFAAGTIVVGGGGDNAATAVGLGLTQGQGGFLSLGTSGVVMVPSLTHRPNPGGGVHAFCHALPNRWLQMGVMLACGDALNWFAGTLGQTAAALVGALPQSLLPPSTAIFRPYLGGERTPHASTTLRASWQGLGFEHDAQAQTHAVLQGISFALRDNLMALDVKPGSLLVAGGGSGSTYWLKMLATILNTPLDVTNAATHAAALGAARLAGAPILRPKIKETIDPVSALISAYQDVDWR